MKNQSQRIVKNKKLARIIAKSASGVYGKRYRAVQTENGYIIGRKKQ